MQCLKNIYNNLVRRFSAKTDKKIMRGLSILSAGNLLARGISVLSLPLLSRVFSSDDFGKVAIIVSLTAILSPIATLRLDQAIPLPKDNKVAMDIASTSVSFAAITSLLLMVMILFGASYLSEISSVRQLGSDIIYLPLFVLFSALYETFTMYSIRNSKYKFIAFSTSVQSCFGAITKLLLGITSFSGPGLLIGQLVSTLSGFLYILFCNWNNAVEASKRFNLQNGLKVIGRYIEYPKYRVPSQVLLMICMQSPVLYFSLHFDLNTTGQLSLALMLIALPMSLIGQSVSRAYYSEVANMRRVGVGNIADVTYSVLLKLFFVSIIPAIVLMFFAQPLFILVFGENWLIAGSFVSKMAIYLVFQFVTAPVMSLFDIFHKQKVFFIFGLIRAIGLLILFSIMSKNNYSSNVVIQFYSIFMIVFYLMISGYILYFITQIKQLSSGPSGGL